MHVLATAIGVVTNELKQKRALFRWVLDSILLITLN